VVSMKSVRLSEVVGCTVNSASVSLKYIYLNLKFKYVSKDYLLQKWKVFFGNIIYVFLFYNYECLLFLFS
jgi:hypothetical protein